MNNIQRLFLSNNNINLILRFVIKGVFNKMNVNLNPNNIRSGIISVMKNTMRSMPPKPRNMTPKAYILQMNKKTIEQSVRQLIETLDQSLPPEVQYNEPNLASSTSMQYNEYNEPASIQYTEPVQYESDNWFSQRESGLDEEQVDVGTAYEQLENERRNSMMPPKPPQINFAERNKGGKKITRSEINNLLENQNLFENDNSELEGLNFDDQIQDTAIDTDTFSTKLSELEKQRDKMEDESEQNNFSPQPQNKIPLQANIPSRKKTSLPSGIDTIISLPSFSSKYILLF